LEPLWTGWLPVLEGDRNYLMDPPENRRHHVHHGQEPRPWARGRQPAGRGGGCGAREASIAPPVVQQAYTAHHAVDRRPNALLRSMARLGALSACAGAWAAAPMAVLIDL